MKPQNKFNKILVVDDSLTVRMEVKKIFESFGYEVLLADGGRQCLELLKTQRPDIILLDVMMPDLGGIEVCRLIKADARLKDIPVLILTSLKTVDEKIKGFQVGAEDYIVKPFVEEELLARVASHLKTGKVLQQLKIEVTERRQAQADLNKAHEELEMRVKDRTRELEEANANLKKEIAQRTMAQKHQKLATRILELLNRPSERTDAIQDILGLIHESTGLEAVGIRLQEGEDFPYYKTTGFPQRFVEAERSLCAYDRNGKIIRDLKGEATLECMCGNIIRGRTDPCLPFFTQYGSFWTNSTTEQNRQEFTRNRCNIEGYESVALIPLHSSDKTIGLLQLNDRRKGMFTPGMISYFEGISASIGISLDRNQAEEALKKDHNELEANVAERIVELAAAKKQAEAAQASAEEANRAKSLFLANMSHELRTPLNAIMGYAQLLQKKVLSPTEQQEHLNIILRNSEFLLALINDVLAISKIEAGQSTLESTTFDLPALFNDLTNAFASSLDAKGLFIEIMGIDDLPRYVTTDKNKLRQVLVNILGNAVKFTAQGGITVRVVANEKAGGAMRLAVEVQDTGMGIAEDELDKVFVYFEQTTGGRSKQSGTGLGLAISRNYLRMMGGDITVTSELGKGSSFRFEIDIKKGDEADLKARIPTQRVTGLQPGQKVPRVLVAEDKRDSRILLVKMLNTTGFEVEEAVNGKEAVAKFNQWQPDFIWMDIRMPVLDGLEATRRIKKTEAGRSTIVTALTAHALEEEKAQILAAGCDDFVRKPFREQEIFEVMAKHLGLKYMYEEAPVEPDAGVETEAQITPQQLTALPDDLMRRLHDAVVELDKERILALSQQIKPIDAHMARALDACVKRFALSPLLELLETIKRPEHGGSYD